MRNFCAALWLPGWSAQSIWGFDEQMDTFFAQLWRDEDTNADPTAWIGGCGRIGDRTQLARLIASVTDNDVAIVTQVMLLDPE